MDNHKVSLYLPCFNAERYIAASIESILAQTRPPDEILVVDDGSVDNTSAIASKYPVRIVNHETNRGLSAARNTGVRASEYDLVACVDADCSPHKNWLEELLGCFKDERISAACGRLVELNCVTGPDKWRSLHLEQSLGLEPVTNPPYLFGHGSIFKKSALLDVGLYNEKLRTNAEDCYITDKLKQAGYRSIYWPRAVVDHHKRDDFGSIIRTAWRWAFFGYLDDIRIGVALRHIVYKWLKLLPSWVVKDLKAGRPDCALISLIAINYSIYKDVEYCMGHLGEKRLFDKD